MSGCGRPAVPARGWWQTLHGAGARGDEFFKYFFIPSYFYLNFSPSLSRAPIKPEHPNCEARPQPSLTYRRVRKPGAPLSGAGIESAALAQRPPDDCRAHFRTCGAATAGHSAAMRVVPQATRRRPICGSRRPAVRSRAGYPVCRQRTASGWDGAKRRLRRFARKGGRGAGDPEFPGGRLRRSGRGFGGAAGPESTQPGVLLSAGSAGTAAPDSAQTTAAPASARVRAGCARSAVVPGHR